MEGARRGGGGPGHFGSASGNGDPRTRRGETRAHPCLSSSCLPLDICNGSCFCFIVLIKGGIVKRGAASSSTHNFGGFNLTNWPRRPPLLSCSPPTHPCSLPAPPAPASVSRRTHGPPLCVPSVRPPAARRRRPAAAPRSLSAPAAGNQAAVRRRAAVTHPHRAR